MNKENTHWVVSRSEKYKKRHGRHLLTCNFSYAGNLLPAIHIGEEK
jgi:hypothetical protein